MITPMSYALDWSVIATWAGVAAAFLAVIAASAQIREAQRQLARQLAHQAATQGRNLLERYLLQALDVVYSEPTRSQESISTYDEWVRIRAGAAPAQVTRLCPPA